MATEIPGSQGHRARVLTGSSQLLGKHHLGSAQRLQAIPKKYPLVMSNIATLWWTNIAIENGPFIDGLPIKNGDFPLLC